MDATMRHGKIKRICLIILIVILSFTLLIAVFLIWNSNRQLLSNDYPNKIKTGGEIEYTYSQYGSYEVSYIEQTVPQNYKKYEIWYPSEMECYTLSRVDKHPKI